MVRPCLAATVLLAAVSFVRSAPPAGYTANVTVSTPTRLDWTFTVTNRSLAEPPPDLIGKEYDSTKQSYELFLPARKTPKQSIGAVVFVSASNDPAGWKAFEPVCKQLGLAFIGVRGAGNDVPAPRRSRVILDCLDDVRRLGPLDADRTYISGISGGGRMACGVGFALPEYFGGLLPIVAGGDLRAEPWLRHRAVDRLSAALVTGQTDFNRGEVERWKGPHWTGIGIRAKVWVQPNMGHAMPSSATLLEAVKWLDEGKDRRAAAAKKSPASRAAPDAVPTRDQAAKALLDEGQGQLAARPTLHRGLMLVKGVSDRWPDTDAGKTARKLLEEYEGKTDRPWEAEDIAEQRTYLTAEARALGDYALNGVPAGSPYEKTRPAMADRAIELWSALVADAPDSDLAREGKKLIAQLRPLTNKEK
ncbi:MAG: alpha/beta hydrolase [Gemmataceae bacterium]|nr:alpha/beta hydrolase [Gemmataceae bacterium]